jgi:hypothetical protein
VPAKWILLHLNVNPLQHSSTVDKRIEQVMKRFGYRKNRKMKSGERGRVYEMENPARSP